MLLFGLSTSRVSDTMKKNTNGRNQVLVSMLSDLLTSLTEERLLELLEHYRSLGPLPGILLPFLKSFVPPLPTLLIVGMNALVYGLWLGVLYTWIGMVSGCLITFLLVRSIAERPFVERWTRKPKVQRGMRWVQRNGFSYVFLLSLLPVGPFVVVNIASGLARMRLRSFAIAVSAGKAVMIFTVSYFGYDLSRYADNPWRLLYIALLIVISLLVSRRLEQRFASASDE
jgi:uncharacterized membrane protein YdjX (TVP38/TMEM64 family)